MSTTEVHQPGEATEGSEESALLDLLEGYSWAPLHNLGCFFLELGQISLAKRAFTMSNSSESLMALADLYYVEKDFVSAEAVWRKIDSSESLEKICVMKELMWQLDGESFFNYFDTPSTQTSTTEQSNIGSRLPLEATPLQTTNDRLEQLYRTVLLFERQQQQGESKTKQVGILVNSKEEKQEPSTKLINSDLYSPVKSVSEGDLKGSLDIKDVEQEGEAAMMRISLMQKQKERSISSNALDFRKPDKDAKPNISNPRSTRHTLHIPKDGTLGRNVPDGLKKVLMEEGILSEAEMAKFEEIKSFNDMNRSEQMDSSAPRRKEHKKGIRRSISNIFRPDIEHEEIDNVPVRTEKSWSDSSTGTSNKNKGLLKRITSSRSARLEMKSEIVMSDYSPPVSPRPRSSSSIPRLFLKFSGGDKDKDKDKGLLSPTWPTSPLSASSPGLGASPKVSGPVRVTHKGHVGVDLEGNLSYNLPAEILELLRPGVGSPDKKR